MSKYETLHQDPVGVGSRLGLGLGLLGGLGLLIRVENIRVRILELG
jgi:hypothetical protein